LSACDGETVEMEARSGKGLGAVVSDLIMDGHATPAAVRVHTSNEVEGADNDSDRGIGLVWTAEPPELQVFRSTAVHFRVTTAPSDHPEATCTWNFGDGSPITEGCTVSHTFHGGRADQVVTLTLDDADWQWTSTRTIALERLAVVHGLEGDGGPTQGLPDRPTPAETTFRFALIADTAAQGGVPSSVEAGLTSLKDRVMPELVIHSGGLVTAADSREEIQQAHTRIGSRLQTGDTTVAWALSPTDRSAKVVLDKPGVQMVDDRFYPERYSFTYKGVYFLMVSAGGPEGVEESTIHWMRDELSKAGIYDARYVVSYLPLHKFGDEHVGSLDKRFRLYELFLRARVTALFSAGYRVYFNGHYGALPIVSVGALAGSGGSLSGSDFAQPNSFVVVDQVGGARERIFAVEGPAFESTLDEGLLPESVEVYTR
jgi:hypothetical protein